AESVEQVGDPALIGESLHPSSDRHMAAFNGHMKLPHVQIPQMAADRVRDLNILRFLLDHKVIHDSPSFRLSPVPKRSNAQTIPSSDGHPIPFHHSKLWLDRFTVSLSASERFAHWFWKKEMSPSICAV